MAINKIKLSTLASASLLSSCVATDDQLPDANHIEALLPQFEDECPAPLTRTLIDVSASDQITYRWGVGDVLGIYPDAGTQVAFELAASSISADGKSATFDGGAWALKGGHSYYAYFPFSYDCFNASVDKTKIPISYLGQKQADFNDTRNAGQYDFNAAPASSSNTGNMSFRFQRLGALLRIKFVLPETSTYKRLTLKTNGAVIPVKGTVDLTQNDITFKPSQKASSLSVDLNNVVGAAGTSVYVYLMLPPLALNSMGETLMATLEYGSDKQTTYNLCTVGTTTPDTPDFVANTRYKRDAVYASGNPEGTMDGGNDEGEYNPDNNGCSSDQWYECYTDFNCSVDCEDFGGICPQDADCDDIS